MRARSCRRQVPRNMPIERQARDGEGVPNSMQAPMTKADGSAADASVDS